LKAATPYLSSKAGSRMSLKATTGISTARAYPESAP
jgi:hypothetical protein